MENKEIRDLDNLIEYGKTSDYSITKCITYSKYNNTIFMDDIVYDKYRDVIDKYAKTIELDVEDQKKYKFRPDLFAYKVYGNSNLSHLILYMNRCSENEFSLDRIRYLDPNSIDDIIGMIIANETNRINDSKKKSMG